ncbi:Flp pilus assembly protein CpaB [Croceicoccus gelatinilyticus]|uniref:Flp pilus assembly protein CpaB n=1 Tax=Croceicoccus gelatinilyticus TaxID=2835536 RepID=UPI001BCE85FF|nr:Flp pilus assembly protein CpaB [Croceicoccus gelatinilyticus]MBS7670731.1 Flp pilus assembly protein CpaB [Croceicoccus gelatinilyticus]
MGSRNLIYILIAVGLGLVAVVLANSYFSGIEERQERSAQEQQLARIVVATQPLDFGSPLTTENIRLQNYPSNSVPVGAFFSIEELLQGGQVALRPIVPGEPILADKLSGRAVLSAKLPDGMRAMSIPISATNAVSGFIRPADIVDVLLTRNLGDDEQVTEVVMEAVQVLAIGTTQSENATEPGLAGTATVLVDLFGAQKLTLARKMGDMSLVLRNVENAEEGPGVAVMTRDVSPFRKRSGGGVSQQAAAAPAPAGPAPSGGRVAAPRPSGPSMTVVRGTAAQDYSVDRLGGN